MSVILSANPAQLREKFLHLRTLGDLAQLLEVTHRQLYFYAFIAPQRKQYKVFQLPKKSGGSRTISAPATPLKIIQRKLNQILQCVYVPKASVHGYVQGRGIVTNARRHLENGNRKRFILNVDLQNFFPSITDSRVRGLLVSVPYSLPENVAEIIVRLCCLDGSLPQGAPTSPILSNMICAKMDTALRRLAQSTKCVYTRYADDITFSTSLPSFPSSVATKDDTSGQLVPGPELALIITSNGFVVNNKKVRLATRFDRQEVTGLTVNEFPNVRRSYARQIRAMLHAWEKYGLEAAQREYEEKYNGPKQAGTAPFNLVVRGKIEFLKSVRGDNNLLYLQFRDKLKRLDSTYKPKDNGSAIARSQKTAVPLKPVYVVTEGRSDWKHIQTAFRSFQAAGKYTGLAINFWEYEDETRMGDAELLRRCELNVGAQLNLPHIYIFDNDNPEIVKKVMKTGAPFKRWGTNLYSFAIPIPTNRQTTPDISLEFYYSDADITRKDAEGRRLFLSTEFDKQSGRLEAENLNCIDPNKFRRPLTIIYNAVYNAKNKNVALPKNDFATYVLQGAPGFENLDCSEFALIFDILEEISRTT